MGRATMATNQTSPRCAESKEETATKPNKPTKGRVVIEKSPLHREETNEKTTISLDVAGFSIEQLKIEMEDHVLSVVGKRTNKLGDTFVTQRRFALKQDIYDEESVKAHLEDGVLDLVVQKKPVVRARMIPITFAPVSPSEKRENQATESSITSRSSSSKEEVEKEKEPKEEQVEHDVNCETSRTASLPAASDSKRVVGVSTVSNKEEEEGGEEEVVFDGTSGRKSPEDISQTSSDIVHDGAWEEVQSQT